MQAHVGTSAWRRALWDRRGAAFTRHCEQPTGDSSIGGVREAVRAERCDMLMPTDAPAPQGRNPIAHGASRGFAASCCSLSLGEAKGVSRSSPSPHRGRSVRSFISLSLTPWASGVRSSAAGTVCGDSCRTQERPASWAGLERSGCGVTQRRRRMRARLTTASRVSVVGSGTRNMCVEVSLGIQLPPPSTDNSVNTSKKLSI